MGVGSQSEISMCSVPLPLIPSRQGRGNSNGPSHRGRGKFTFNEFVNNGPSGFISYGPPVMLPETLALPALGESWRVEYLPTRTRRIGILMEEPGRLTVYGAVADHDACRAVLKQWLKRRTREELVPWLSRLAGENGFRFGEVLIRGQKTRWASCSSKGTISLSYKLLFLERDSVRCVLLHELCHTAVMNHSRRFWTLLCGLEPNCKAIRKRMRDGWKQVPAWVEGRAPDALSADRAHPQRIIEPFSVADSEVTPMPESSTTKDENHPTPSLPRRGEGYREGGIFI